jgi:hypothetical protein
MKEPRKRAGKDPRNQGEGDHAADRRYRARTRRFLKNADPEELAREAAPGSRAEADQLEAAEKQGRAHAHQPDTHRVNKSRDDG